MNKERVDELAEWERNDPFSELCTARVSIYEEECKEAFLKEASTFRQYLDCYTVAVYADSLSRDGIIIDFKGKLKDGRFLNRRSRFPLYTDCTAYTGKSFVRTAVGIFLEGCIDKIREANKVEHMLIPDKVITSGPYTHVFSRGRKLATVRKSESDSWNAEKGFAMAICKVMYDKDTFEDLIKYAGKETVIAFAKYAMGIPGYLELRRNGWKQYK